MAVFIWSSVVRPLSPNFRFRDHGMWSLQDSFPNTDSFSIRHQQSHILQLKHVIGLSGLRYRPELGRKGGSAAFWVRLLLCPSWWPMPTYTYALTIFLQIYSEFHLPAYPNLTPFIKHHFEYTQDLGTSVGGYWKQPVRNILANHLVKVPEPNREIFEPLEQVYFTGDF